MRSENDTFVADKLKELKHEAVLNQIKEIIDTYPEIALESISHLFNSTSTERIKQVVNLLNQKLEEMPASNSSSSSSNSSTNQMTPTLMGQKLTKQATTNNSQTGGLANTIETPPSPFNQNSNEALIPNGNVSSTPKSNRN